MSQLPTTYKIIFIGNSGVGKTSIIRRKKDNVFQLIVDPTVGTGRTTIEVQVEETKAELCLWDTAGQEKYAQLLPLFVKDTDVAVVVASYTDYQSIEKIDEWISLLHKNNENPELVIVINKTDMANSLSEDQDAIGSRLAQKYTNIFFTSAKTGTGIDDLFEKISYLVVKNPKQEEAPKEEDEENASKKKKEKHKKEKECYIS